MAAKFRLVVRAGGLAGQTFPLEGTEILIGRSAECHISIPEPELSRRHARLIYQAGGYMIEDLNSTNGTFVNGQRVVGPHPLQPGDRIRLGPKTELVYEPEVFDPEATVAVPSMQPTPTAQPTPRPATPVPPQPSPVPTAGAEEARSGPNWMLIGFVGVLLLALCACVGILWYIDANYLWCTVFPFLPGC